MKTRTLLFSKPDHWQTQDWAFLIMVVSTISTPCTDWGIRTIHGVRAVGGTKPSGRDAASIAKIRILAHYSFLPEIPLDALAVTDRAFDLLEQLCKKDGSAVADFLKSTSL